jgi:hypothetical protein
VPSDYQRCAELIAQADGLLITAGAGIGVDSGLPDFRGAQGFWGAYPALGRARIAFEQIANPAAFERQPRLAWGFYGHRLQLYRRTVPQQGFAILRRIGESWRMAVSYSPAMSTGNFRKRVFPTSASANATAPSITCSAALAVALTATASGPPTTSSPSSTKNGAC